jgi:tight adherence protein C
MYLLGIACGAVAALPFALLARREAVTGRLRMLAPAPPSGFASLMRDRFPRTAERLAPRLAMPAPIVSIGRVLRAPGVRRRRRRRDVAIGRELPVIVDLVGVALAGGCTPFLAIEHAAQYGPRRTASAMQDVRRACALGRSLDDALRDLGAQIPSLRPLAETLRTSARLGTPAAPALARLAAEVRADHRRRAEARARTVPVRLCFPLVACVLPAFGLLTVAPVVLGGLHT